MDLLTQEGLREWFKEVTGIKASTERIKACILDGMPYTQLGKRKLFNPSSVLAWLRSKEQEAAITKQSMIDRRFKARKQRS